MKQKSGPFGPQSINGVAAAIGLLAITFLLLAAPRAGAAEGDPFAVDFDHAGLVIGVATGGDLNEMILTPGMTDENDDPLGPLEVRGSFTDGEGNFDVPKETGFTFPTIAVPIRGIPIAGDIDLTEDASGHYDPATGSMELDAKLALTLSLDEIGDLPEPVGSLGSGPLECRFSPLDIHFSTDPVNWPAPGIPFADTGDLTGGAIAGGWNVKPKVTAVSGEPVCKLLAGTINSIGGIYLANSSTPVAEIPEPTGPRPIPEPCPAGTTGMAGDPESCKPVTVKPPVCPAGKTGTPPNCTAVEDPDPVPLAKAVIEKVVISPAPLKVKPGTTKVLKIKVTNTGGAAAEALPLLLKSSNGQVKVPGKTTISVGASSTATKTVTVKIKKKAKGKATITATAAGKKGKSVLSIKKAKAKKKR